MKVKVKKTHRRLEVKKTPRKWKWKRAHRRLKVKRTLESESEKVNSWFHWKWKSCMKEKEFEKRMKLSPKKKSVTLSHLQAALPVSQLSNAFESKMPQIVCEGKYNIWHGWERWLRLNECDATWIICAIISLYNSEAALQGWPCISFFVLEKIILIAFS